MQEFGERSGNVGEAASLGEGATSLAMRQTFNGISGKSTIRAGSPSVDSCALRGAITREVELGMRRLLIALTLVLLLAVSVGIGVLIAGWPHWQETLF